jgi:hypothetical protein
MSFSHCVKENCRRFSFNRLRVEVCIVMALGLFLGMAGQTVGQPTHNFTTLDVPGSSIPNSTSANGINASGQIVGNYTVGMDESPYFGASGSRGFLLDNGRYTTLDVPGWPFTSANGINASGQIVE